MVRIQTLLYQCAKFHNFPASGSMGCHILPERKKKKKNRTSNGYNRCHLTFGAWPLITSFQELTITIFQETSHFIAATKIKSIFNLETKTKQNKKTQRYSLVFQPSPNKVGSFFKH